MSWNKLEFLGIPRTLGIHFARVGLISLTTFLYRHKLTWQVDVQGCKKLHATVWQKLITVAKGKAKIEMSPFS